MTDRQTDTSPLYIYIFIISITNTVTPWSSKLLTMAWRQPVRNSGNSLADISLWLFAAMVRLWCLSGGNGLWRRWLTMTMMLVMISMTLQRRLFWNSYRVIKRDSHIWVFYNSAYIFHNHLHQIWKIVTSWWEVYYLFLPCPPFLDCARCLPGPHSTEPWP